MPKKLSVTVTRPSGVWALNSQKDAAGKNTADYILEALAQNDYPLAARMGEKHLNDADQWVCRAFPKLQDKIVYSLFGSDPKYCETLLVNLTRIARLYPEYQVCVYHDDTVPNRVVARLVAQGAQMRHVRTCGIAHWPGTFWRFHAVQDAQAGFVLFRDADSLVTEEEAEWVRQWRNSDRPFHVMRDWYSHTDLILAGLWGGYAPYLQFMQGAIEHYLSSKALHRTHADQHFLADVVWPRIKVCALVHDSVHPHCGVSPENVTAPDVSGRAPLARSFMSVYSCPFDPETTPRYAVTLYDRAGCELVTYMRENRHGQRDEFQLPYAYKEMIDRGDLSLGYTIPLAFGLNLGAHVPSR